MAASTPIFLNNVASTISAVASGATTTVTVAAGDGAKFGAVAAGQYIPIVIVDPSTSPETVKEYMWVTGVAGDVLTVTRAAESGATYPAGALAAGLTVAAVASATALSMSVNSAYGPGTMQTGAIAETISRKHINNSGLTLSSGAARGVLTHFAAGAVITSLTFVTAGTALAGGTHQWFAVLDVTGKVVGVTADDTNAAWAANTHKTLALTSPLTIPTAGGYYLTKSITATTMPTFYGLASTGLPSTETPLVCGSATGQSGPPSIGATLTLSLNTSIDYGYAS